MPISGKQETSGTKIGAGRVKMSREGGIRKEDDRPEREQAKEELTNPKRKTRAAGCPESSKRR